MENHALEGEIVGVSNVSTLFEKVDYEQYVSRGLIYLNALRFLVKMWYPNHFCDYS